MLERAGYWATNAAILFLLWVLFVGEWKTQEMIVGAAASALAATGVEVARGVQQPRFLPRAGWLLQFWRVPFLILRDCALLIRNLGRAHGSFRVVPFPDAAGDDPESAARRALAIVYTTLPPNSLVIGIDRRHDRMLLHEIQPGERQ